MKCVLLLALVSVQVFRANSRYSKDLKDEDRDLWGALNYVNEAMKGGSRVSDNRQYYDRRAASGRPKYDSSQWGQVVEKPLPDLYYKDEYVGPDNYAYDYYNFPHSDPNKILAKLLSYYWQGQMDEKNNDPSGTRLKYPTGNVDDDKNYYEYNNENELDDYFHQMVKEPAYPDYTDKFQQNNIVWVPKSESDIKEIERLPNEEELNAFRTILDESVDKLINTAAETIAEDIIMGILESEPDNVDELTQLTDEMESDDSNESVGYENGVSSIEEEEVKGTQPGEGEEMIGYDEADSKERDATAQFLPKESNEQSDDLLQEEEISNIMDGISSDSDILKEEDLELIDLLVKEWEGEKEEAAAAETYKDSSESAKDTSSEEENFSTEEIMKSFFDDFKPEPTSSSDCPAVQYMSDGCAAVDAFPGLGDNGYKTAFLGPCNRHQICYLCGQTYKISQEICDEAFYTAIQDECDENETCSLHADYFYVAVLETRRTELSQSEPSPIQNIICQRSCVLDYLKGKQ